MSTHTPTPPVTPTRTPGRSHRVAGPAAWILGMISTALSTVFVIVEVVAVANGDYVGPNAGVTFILLGVEAVVLAFVWLAFLIPFVPLRRDRGVTRPAFWSAVVVGLAAGALLFAYLV